MADPRTENVRTALAWLAAVNDRDWEALAAVSAPDILMHHPLGSARGLGMLRGWFEAIDMRVEPVRVYEEGGGVLVEHRARWVDPAGKVSPERTVATILDVQDGRVTTYRRSEAGEGLLDQFGFEPADEVPFRIERH